MPDNDQIQLAMESLDHLMGSGYCMRHPEIVAAIITSLATAQASENNQDSLSTIESAIDTVRHAIKHKE